MSGSVFWERCARIALILELLALVAVGPARRVEAQDRSAAAVSKTAHVRHEQLLKGLKISPWIEATMKPPLAAKLRSAIDLAADHLESEEACRGLRPLFSRRLRSCRGRNNHLHRPVRPR